MAASLSSGQERSSSPWPNFLPLMWRDCPSAKPGRSPKLDATPAVKGGTGRPADKNAANVPMDRMREELTRMQEEVIEGFRLSPQQRNLWLIQKKSQAFRSECAILIDGS